MKQKYLSTITSLSFLLVLLVATSCVSSKKYDLSENKRQVAEERFKQARADIRELNDTVKDCKNQSEVLQSRISRMEKDTVTLNKLYRDCKEEIQRLEQASNLTQAQYAAQLRDKEKQLADKKRLIDEKERLISEKEKEIAEKTKRLEELESIIAQQNQIVDKLRQTVADALVSFDADELTVEIRNGKVYVSLSSNLLFKSGSTNVDPKGKDALKKLAVVLKNNPDISIMIEGHTDDKPMNSSCIKDNWDLSVLRATSIVKILTKENDLATERIVPSGRGEFFPVASNETADGRQKNRRIEVILSPKLDELFKLLDIQGEGSGSLDDLEDDNR